MINKNGENTFTHALKRKIYHSIIGLTAFSALFGFTGALTKKNDSSSQIEMAQTEEDDNKKIITLRQLYDQLELDKEMFKPSNYDKMTLQEKIAAEEQTLKDAGWVIRTKLALAITEGTGTLCHPEDVHIVYYSNDYDGGITWEGTDNNFTIQGRGFNDKKIDSPELEKIIDRFIIAETGRHYNNEDAVTSTRRIYTNDHDEDRIPKRFFYLCDTVLQTENAVFIFNGESFRSRVTENNRVLNYAFFTEDISELNEDSLSQSQLDEHLKADLTNFQNPFRFNQMTLAEQTALEKKARLDVSFAIRKIISESVGCSPDSVYIVNYLYSHDFGFTWEGSEHTYTTKGFNGHDSVMPEDLAPIISSLVHATSISHLDSARRSKYYWKIWSK